MVYRSSLLEELKENKGEVILRRRNDGHQTIQFEGSGGSNDF